MFSLTHDPIDLAHLSKPLLDLRAGACVNFEGWVRNHHQGRAVTGLHYQAHEALALDLGNRVLADVCAEFELLHCVCAHRLGELELGALAVWVGVSAGHRDAAFAACRRIIDRIKLEVPIWKREHYVDASSQWLHPSAS
jgi:molybdopterin synthase catalytic subunit